MSLGIRQLSGSKLKFDADYYKNILQQLERKRPGSGQPLLTVTSPQPPRKPVYSGKLKNIILPSENINQHHRIIKSGNSQYSQQQLTPSVTQSQLLGIVSPLKANKPPLQFDKKLLLPKQNASPQIQIKSSQVLNQISTGEKRLIQNSIEKPGILTSPGQNNKQFTWNNQIELIVTQSDIENKRRQISNEKLKQLPKKQFQQQPIDQKRLTQPISQQMQSHIVISKPKQIMQTQQIKKKQTFNPKQSNINIQSLSQFQGSQPKCFSDFTMTSGRNDLQQLFTSMQLQFKEAFQQAEQHQNLNMSEIQEQSDDANSSLAQSTLCQFQK
ncbi:unnamed protein product [Paramecium octaurelia]|uniref:Uncharacterized protein n=1 Tax=Paramecium octaurelia TaxID=43137 RepID=A0A8S1UAC7_PAROT|nr:unnamed protein product [Paramecium octaurelia]